MFIWICTHTYVTHTKNIEDTLIVWQIIQYFAFKYIFVFFFYINALSGSGSVWDWYLKRSITLHLLSGRYELKYTLRGILICILCIVNKLEDIKMYTLIYIFAESHSTDLILLYFLRKGFNLKGVSEYSWCGILCIIFGTNISWYRTIDWLRNM